jgi:ankyrin repeat protein
VSIFVVVINIYHDDIKLIITTYPYDPTRRACLCGHTEVVHELLRAGADPMALSGAGDTPLHAACRGGGLGPVHALLTLGPQILRSIVDAASGDGVTPLGEAARGGHSEICELLLKHGAYIDAISSSGNTALHWASIWGAAAVVEVLIMNGADTEVLNKAEKSALEVVITVDEAAREAVVKTFNEVFNPLKL